MTNSFGDGVTVETTDKSIQILDLGGVSLDLLNRLNRDLSMIISMLNQVMEMFFLEI